MQIFSNKRHFLPEISELSCFAVFEWEAGVLEVSPAGGWW
jgi:hypothetical protein